jgi:hypothetical protein
MVGNHPETNNRTGFSVLSSGCRWSDGTFHIDDPAFIGGASHPTTIPTPATPASTPDYPNSATITTTAAPAPPSASSATTPPAKDNPARCFTMQTSTRAGSSTLAFLLGALALLVFATPATAAPFEI